jgi:hypothetical protein
MRGSVVSLCLSLRPSQVARALSVFAVILFSRAQSRQAAEQIQELSLSLPARDCLCVLGALSGESFPYRARKKIKLKTTPLF